MLFTCRRVASFPFSVSKFNTQKDYYKALGVASKADKDQIKKAFRNLAKKYHPDANKGYQDKFKDVNEAYQVLSDSEIKKQYDEARLQQKNNPKQYQQSQQNQQYQQYQQQQQSYRPCPEDPYRSAQNPYDYEQPPPRRFRSEAEYRAYLRQKHQQIMNKYTYQRHNYDNFGRSYQNYDKFAQEMMRKKAEQFEQDRVTLQSVRRQEEQMRRMQEQREAEEFRKKRAQLEKQFEERYERAVKNGKQMAEGVKKMTDFVRNLFKGK